MQIYLQGWFTIKFSLTLKNDSKNLWNTISLSAYLGDPLKEITHKVIQANGYSAHPENLLC